MDKTLYKQCRLKRGSQYDTAYIPTRFAIKGKFLKLKDVDGWEVINVGKRVVNADEVSDISRDFTKTRKASDI